MQTPLPQQAAGSKNATPQPIAASGSAQQATVGASPAGVDSTTAVPNAEEGAIAVPASALAAGAAIAVGAQGAALPQDVPAIAAETADKTAANAGVAATAPSASNSQPGASPAESATAAAAIDRAQPRAALPMAGAHAPQQLGATTADAASIAGPASDASPTAAQTGDALQPNVQTAAAASNPIPPAANPLALNLGAQAAAAIQGMTPAPLVPAANPAGNPVGQGGVAGLAASAARAATASTEREKVLATSESADKDADSDSDSGTPPPGTPGGSFGVVQALVNANSTSTTDGATVPTLKVSQPLESQEFGQGVSNQVSVMMDNNLNVAKLQVNPASLGPIEVRIALQAGHAQVWMTSHSAVTRDALQDSSSHLKDMLGQQGFGQVSVDISHRQFQERTPQSFTYESNSAPEASASSAAVQSASPAAARRSNGKLDAYA